LSKYDDKLKDYTDYVILTA